MRKAGAIKISDGTNLVYEGKDTKVGDIVPDKEGTKYIVHEMVDDTVTKAHELVYAPTFN